MVCDGPNWCLADCMLTNYFQTLSKTYKTGVIRYFVTDRHFLRDRQTFGKFFKMAHIKVRLNIHSALPNPFCFAEFLPFGATKIQ